jgi:NAD+ synthase
MRTIPIETTVQALRDAYAGATDARLTGVADENVQARARGVILMAISNQEGRILLTTGNKSEVSVGYSTLYGDMSGGFNPIKDCYKTTVWELCRWRNGLTADDLAALNLKGPVGEVVPEAIITKPPSAELRAEQKDEDSLPPYPVLDAILRRMIETEASVPEIVAEGYDEAVVHRVRALVDGAEYKRRQAAPGVKITSKLYGRDRRYPIVNRWRT